MAAGGRTLPGPRCPRARARRACPRTAPASRSSRTPSEYTPVARALSAAGGHERQTAGGGRTSGKRFSAYTMSRHVLPQPPGGAALSMRCTGSEAAARTVTDNDQLSLHVRPPRGLSVRRGHHVWLRRRWSAGRARGRSAGAAHGYGLVSLERTSWAREQRSRSCNEIEWALGGGLGRVVFTCLARLPRSPGSPIRMPYTVPAAARNHLFIYLLVYLPDTQCTLVVHALLYIIGIVSQGI